MAGGRQDRDGSENGGSQRRKDRAGHAKSLSGAVEARKAKRLNRKARLEADEAHDEDMDGEAPPQTTGGVGEKRVRDTCGEETGESASSISNEVTGHFEASIGGDGTGESGNCMLSLSTHQLPPRRLAAQIFS